VVVAATFFSSSKEFFREFEILDGQDFSLVIELEELKVSPVSNRHQIRGMVPKAKDQHGSTP
jgi:hypothetical protein